MHQIWPWDKVGSIDTDDLHALYGYPDHRKWLAVNFVSSVDGAVEIGGRSQGLTNPADRQVYPLGSDLADVILVGATTAITEGFRGVRPSEEVRRLRQRHGLAPVPPIAVVTSGKSLPAEAPVINDVLTPSIVLTCTDAPLDKQEAWVAAGAELIITGTESVNMGAAVDRLTERGLRRIHCDGGHKLFGAALAAGVVDELRLTLSPLLVAGAAERIATDAAIDPTALTLDSVLAEDDTLMLRYVFS